MGVLGVLFAPRWLLARSILGCPAVLRKQACVTERRLVKSCHYSEASCDVKQHLLRVLVQFAFLCVLCVLCVLSEFLIRATQPRRKERGDHAEKRREMKWKQYPFARGVLTLLTLFDLWF